MIARPNRPEEYLLLHQGIEQQMSVEDGEPISPDEYELTSAEHAASRRQYLISLSLTILAVLILLALLFFALR